MKTTTLLKTKKLKNLERKWYKKLEDSGFTDIENTKLSSRPLYNWASSNVCNQPLIIRITNEIYFQKAEKLLETYPFKSPTHEAIWELHCQGLSTREIEKELSHVPKCSQQNISHVICTIAKLIKL